MIIDLVLSHFDRLSVATWDYFVALAVTTSERYRERKEANSQVSSYSFSIDEKETKNLVFSFLFTRNGLESKRIELPAVKQQFF